MLRPDFTVHTGELTRIIKYRFVAEIEDPDQSRRFMSVFTLKLAVKTYIRTFNILL